MDKKDSLTPTIDRARDSLTPSMDRNSLTPSMDRNSLTPSMGRDSLIPTTDNDNLNPDKNRASFASIDGVIQFIAVAATGSIPDATKNTVNEKLRETWRLTIINDPLSYIRDKEVFIFYDDDDERTVLTNKDVQDLSTRCASYLASHGVKKGDVVCNLLRSSIEASIVNFGILLAGAVVMSGDVLGDRPGRHFWPPIIQARAQYIIVSPDPYSHAWKMLRDNVIDGGTEDDDVVVLDEHLDIPEVKKIFKMFQIHNIEKRVRGNYRSVLNIIRAHENKLSVNVNGHDPCLITVSKEPEEDSQRSLNPNNLVMVLRSHKCVVQMAQQMADNMGCTLEDVIYERLTHLIGLPYLYFTTGCSTVRSTLCSCPEKDVVAATWSIIERENVTLASFSLPMIQMLTAHCEDLEPRQQHSWTLRSVAIDARSAEKCIFDAIGPVTQSIVVLYSRIETGLIASHVVDRENKDDYIDGCVGSLYTRPEHVSTTCKRGGAAIHTQPAEILVDGPLVVKEYHNDPARTRAFFTTDGYFRTGDIGVYIHDRHRVLNLILLGRKAECIQTDSGIVIPRRAEELLALCPGVWKAKIVYIKPKDEGLCLVACIIPRYENSTSIQKVTDFVRFHQYDVQYIMFFDSYPTVGGKVNRKMLAYMANESMRSGNAL